jgi:hypothetical protein
MEYLTETWFDPRLATGPSLIHGTGLFATAPLVAREVVLVWGGSAWTRAQLDADEVPPANDRGRRGDHGRLRALGGRGEVLVEACTCGAETCRGVVRGTDWQRPELQDCYAGHFLPYIERRFRQSV